MLWPQFCTQFYLADQSLVVQQICNICNAIPTRGMARNSISVSEAEHARICLPVPRLLLAIRMTCHVFSCCSIIDPECRGHVKPTMTCELISSSPIGEILWSTFHTKETKPPLANSFTAHNIQAWMPGNAVSLKKVMHIYRICLACWST